MIVFDLRCGHGHVFEVWFRSTADYEDQRDRALVACPVCNDTQVEKAVMAPNVAAKGNQRISRPSAPAAAETPEEAKQLVAKIAEIQAKMLENSQWVGTAFADTARAMHQGDEPTRQIHGQTSLAEARELAEEGVPVAPLLVPVVPPEARN